MKMRILFFCFLIGSSCAVAETENSDAVDTSQFELVDQIEAVVFGHEDMEIITKSDIDRPSLGGGFRTIDEIIFECEVMLDAKKHKIPQDDEAIEAYLTQVQRENDLSDKDLETIFTSAGYTIQEGREQLARMQTVNTMLDIKVRSNLIVPRRDVEQYYHEHPIPIEATYTLERMFVPQSKRLTAEKQYDMLVHFAKTGKGITGVSWSAPFTIQHSDVAENKRFIYDLHVGEVSLPEPFEDGFELFKLVAKTEEQVKTLEESYREIVDILRRPKYEELIAEYRNFLLNNNSVFYF